MTRRTLNVRAETWPLAKPFVISRGTFTHVHVIVAEIGEDGHTGRGEATGVSLRRESPATMLPEVEAVRGAIEAGAGRDELTALMPPGGARNALDCALWELKARLAGSTVAALAGLEATAFQTVATVSVGSPQAMAAEAAGLAAFPLIKVKLGADDPQARIAAVRAARPDVRLIVDVNTAWAPRDLARHAPALAALGVEMIEQPCDPAVSGELRRDMSPVPLCADEAVNTADDLGRVGEGYAMVNIKLDKTGGLTEAIRLARAARARGLGLMVGNMLGTSLAMAPASLLAPLCRYVDLDGPLLLARDRAPGMAADGPRVAPMVPGVWG